MLTTRRYSRRRGEPRTDGVAEARPILIGRDADREPDTDREGLPR